MTLLRQGIAKIEIGLDEVFSGRWWWRVRRFMAERRLERALNRHGETSLTVRRETEQCRRMQFAVEFWRSAPSQVRQVVRRAKQAGVHPSDLQLMVLNTDLRTRGDRPIVRRSSVAKILSAAMAIVVGVHWFLMYAMAVTAPGPAWLKILVIIGIFTVYATLYRGWSLYAYRSLVAVARSGEQLDQLCADYGSESGARIRKIPSPSH